MPLIRYTEILGDTRDNAIRGSQQTITLGSHGDDSLYSTPGRGNTVLVGGNGNDFYVVESGSAVSISDLSNSANDSAILNGMFFGTTDVFTVDNLHLMAIDSATGTEVVIFNWLDSNNKIENIHLEDASFTTDQLNALLPSLEGYLGNLTMDNTNIIPDGFSADDVREAIEFYTIRNTEVHATNDFLSGASASGGDINDAFNGYGGNDTLLGNEGNDTLKGGSGDDLIDGGSGVDFSNGNAGNDTVNGGIGDDIRLLGGRDADIVHGNNGNDFVNGNKGNDSVYGDNDNDTVHGGTADDVIFGNGGNDFLYGDKGNDTIDGGTGADTFVFNASNSGIDVVNDFVSGIDIIELKNSTFANTTEAAAAFSGGILDLGNGNTVAFTGITALVESDFIIG